MTDTYFKILRPGINTTIQDKGRHRLYHLGVTVSGVMDQRNYKLVNNLVNNQLNEAVIEFAYQGPLLKLINGNINFAITGKIFFNIIRNNSKIEEGKCYRKYNLNEGDQIDIISTNKSVYGYLSVSGGFELEKMWNSYSINTKAQIGPNDGKKYSINEKIFIKKSKIENTNNIEIDYKDSFNNIVRVLRGTNFDYFSQQAKNLFFNEAYSVTRYVDRMGMRLDGPNLENVVSTNIKSEGLIRGVIQVPADGKPIILLSDHGTIGGYPKIGNVISADLDKVAQLTLGTKIQFKEVNLEEAEKLFKSYTTDTNKYLYEYN